MTFPQFQKFKNESTHVFVSSSTCSSACLPAAIFAAFCLRRRLWRRLRCAEDSDSFSALRWFPLLLHASSTETPAPTYFLQIGPAASQSESDSPPPGESLGCKHRDIDRPENEEDSRNKRKNAKYFLTMSPPLLLSLSPGSVAWNSNGFMDTSFCVPSYQHQQRQQQSYCTEH